MQLRPLIHDARTAAELAHVRPAYAAGMRAAIATIAPLLIAPSLPAGAASWASLAGLNGALGDRGGPYRMRATVMGALTVASAIAAFIACVVAPHPVLAVAVTFALALACGLVRAWNDVGPGFGVAILVTFAISLAVPAPTIDSALVRAAFIIAGGLWALIVAVVLWPIRPYRPVRLRITECYRSIARYVEAAEASVDMWSLKSHLVAVRTAIENARTALAVTRLGRATESGRGERLLVLHEIADQIYVHIIAVLEESDALSSREQLIDILASIATTARGIADAVESEFDLPRVPVTFTGASIRAENPLLAEVIDRIADFAKSAAEIAATLNRGTSSVATDIVDVAEPPAEPVLFSLSAVLRPSSVVLHHALRVAIVTSLAVAITSALHLNHGYWVTLTAVVILQPFAATTRQKALQRVVGTILGGIVAAALSAMFHGGVAVLICVAIFTFLCVALLPLNYGAYAVFGTPAFVLLAEASAGDWHLAGLRIVNTLIGGALALVGARVLWRGDERAHLPELAAAAIGANDTLLARALELLVGRTNGDVGVLRDARRDVAFAVTNAEDSFQRLMSDHKGSPEELEAIMTFLVYSRRFAASTAALVVSSAPNGRLSPSDVEPFERAAHRVLADLRDAIAVGRAPVDFPTIGSITTHPRLTRLARQLRQLHSAVARWLNDSTSPTQG